MNVYRSIFISDIHLGTTACQAQRLIEFFHNVDSEYLFLVGDIVDCWQLRKHWYWPQSHNDVVQKILRKARKGTKVIYVPGNHDEYARQFEGMSFGGIKISNEYVHLTANDKSFLVVHGDMFDAVVQYSKWLVILGDELYSVILSFNHWMNLLRARLGLPYWSLAGFLKGKVRGAISYILDFEKAIVREAGRRGYDGVVCGHIHKAEIRDIDGVLYCNSGDWVDSLTAIGETFDGELEIIRWK